MVIFKHICACPLHSECIMLIITFSVNQQGRYIYERGSMKGKRVQSNMGAKNHGVVMPDANKESTLTQLVGAAFGAAGQR